MNGKFDGALSDWSAQSFGAWIAVLVQRECRGEGQTRLEEIGSHALFDRQQPLQLGTQRRVMDTQVVQAGLPFIGAEVERLFDHCMTHQQPWLPSEEMRPT